MIQQSLCQSRRRMVPCRVKLRQEDSQRDRIARETPSEAEQSDREVRVHPDLKETLSKVYYLAAYLVSVSYTLANC